MSQVDSATKESSTFYKHCDSEDSFIFGYCRWENSNVEKCHPIFKRLEDAYKEKYGDPEYAKEQLKQLQKKKQSTLGLLLLLPPRGFFIFSLRQA